MSASSTPMAARIVLGVGYVVMFAVGILTTILALWWVGSTFGGIWVILLLIFGGIPGVGIVAGLAFVPFWGVARLLGARDDALEP
ncbi:MAG: hypothetical protein AB7R89_19000 [Dehalococcoidia bacterium]